MNPKLQELYDKIPKVKCPQGCTKCCGPVGACPSEAKKLGLKKPYTDWDEEFYCQFRTEEGCSVYENRPFTCRLFGTGCCVMNCPIISNQGTLNMLQEKAFLAEYFIIQTMEGEKFDVLMNEEFIEAQIQREMLAQFKTKKQAENVRKFHKEISKHETANRT
jgi:hypothetical protein